MGKKLFNFIIGNPPYQESDGGAGASATPVYNKFIEASKELDPDVMSYIIPAKWYSGGKGLDKFREEMLSDPHMAVLEDFTNSQDVFPGVNVAGGVCYFIRDKKHEGKCEYTNHFRGKVTTEFRDLSQAKTFIRYPIAARIVNKVASFHEKALDSMVSTRKPFGLPTTAKPIPGGDLTLRYNGGKGPYPSDKIVVGKQMINQWKVIISYLTAEHAGQPDKKGQFRVLSTMEELQPKEICSETYLVAGAFDTKEEADNYFAYLKTRFARFLLQQIALTQHISKSTFAFVPCQDFHIRWNDNKLFDKYGLDEDERSFINGLIKEMA